MKENKPKIKNWDQQSDSSGEYPLQVQPAKKAGGSVASSVSEYTEKECKYLDRFLAEVENAIDVK
jgi:hypothetical protein